MVVRLIFVVGCVMDRKNEGKMYYIAVLKWKVELIEQIENTECKQRNRCRHIVNLALLLETALANWKRIKVESGVKKKEKG